MIQHLGPAMSLSDAPYLLTAYGTIVCYKKTDILLVKQRSIVEKHKTAWSPIHFSFSDNNHSEKQELRNLISSEIDVPAVLVFVEQGQSVGTISIRSEQNTFLTATSGMSIGMEHREQVGHLESFFPITERQLSILRWILSNDWLVSSSHLLVKKERSALGRDFLLFLGQFKVDLIKTLSLNLLEQEKMQVALTGSSDEVVSIERSCKKSSPYRKRIWILPSGNMGNRALQYLTAEGIRVHFPGVAIENLGLPEWGRISEDPRPSESTAVRPRQSYWMDVAGLADCLQRDVIDSIIIDGYPFHMDHYPSRAVARELFGPTLSGLEATGFGENELVCSVRANEILMGGNRDYLVLPPSYYQLLVERTGLKLVFFGQLGTDLYSESLRQAFPKARFVPGRNPGYDFDMLRRSANIALSISTFAWLAAWLSEAQKVFLPVTGMFNPVQHPHQMYMPFDEDSYEFILLPYSKALNLYEEPERFKTQQDLLKHHVFISRSEARELYRRALLLSPLRPTVGGFDPHYYVQHASDAALQVCSGDISALQHYYTSHWDGRTAVPIDDDFYLHAYPDAALEIAQGFYSNPQHHYTAVGWRKHNKINNQSQGNERSYPHQMSSGT